MVEQIRELWRLGRGIDRAKHGASLQGSENADDRLPAVLEERHELENSRGVDQPRIEQRFLGREAGAVVAKQEIVFDEFLNLSFDFPQHSCFSSGDRITLRQIGNSVGHLDEDAMPQLSGENPAKRRIVAEAERALASAFLNEPLDRYGIEIAGRRERAPRYCVADPGRRSQREEASAVRRAIRLLGSLGNFLRQQAR